MPVKIQLTLKDYLRAYRAHAGWSYFFLPAWGSMAILAGIFHSSILMSTAHGIVLIAVGVFLISLLPMVLRRHFKCNKKLVIPYNVTASSEGIELAAEYGNSFTRWQAFVQFAETNDVFLLYPQPRLYQMFPKRFFSPEQLEEFNRLVRAHVAPKKGEGKKIVWLLVFWGAILIAAIVSYQFMKRSGQ
jgi:hypothetical protein